MKRGAAFNMEFWYFLIDLLPFQWRHRNPAVSSVGRLDKETSGLLLLTDYGKFIHRMTSPRHHVAKVYEAVTEKDIPTEAVELFASGTLTLNGETRPCAPALLEQFGLCADNIVQQVKALLEK